MKLFGDFVHVAFEGRTPARPPAEEDPLHRRSFSIDLPDSILVKIPYSCFYGSIFLRYFMPTSF